MEKEIVAALQGKAKELMALRGTSQHNAESEKLSLLLFQAANLIAQQATDNQVWSAGYVRREFELDAERRLKEKALEKYATAARVIALYLYEFCDRSKPYDEMVADAVRRAAARLEQLKQERDTLYEDIVSRPGGNELLDLGNIYRSLTLCSDELVNPLTSVELVKLTERIYETRYLSGTPVMMDERVDAVRFMLEYGISPNRSPEFSSLSADKARELLCSCDMEVFVDLVDAVTVDGYEYYGRDFYLDAEAMDRIETAIQGAQEKPAALDEVVQAAEALKEASAGGRGAVERGVEDTVVR